MHTQAGYMRFYADRMGFETARREEFESEAEPEAERKPRAAKRDRNQQTPSPAEDRFAAAEDDGRREQF